MNRILPLAAVLLGLLSPMVYAQTTNDYKSMLDTRRAAVLATLERETAELRAIKTELSADISTANVLALRIAENTLEQIRTGLQKYDENLRAQIGTQLPINRTVYDLFNIQLTILDKSIAFARQTRQDTYKLYRKIKSGKKELQDLFDQATGLNGQNQNPLAQELFKNAVRHSRLARQNFRDGYLIVAQLHILRCRQLLQKTIEVLQKNADAAGIAAREWEQLQELLARTEEKAGQHAQARKLLDGARALHAQIASSIRDKKYVAALKLIEQAEELLNNAGVLASKSQDESVKDDQRDQDQYSSLRSDVEQRSRQDGAPTLKNQIRRLLTQAAELTEKARQASGENPLAARQLRRQAIKLLLRAQDMLTSGAANSLQLAERELSAVQQLTDQTEQKLAEIKNQAAADLYRKAVEFHKKAKESFAQKQYAVALEQLKMARKLFTRALQMTRDAVTGTTIGDKTVRELAEVEELVNSAQENTALAPNPQARDLARLAAGLLAKARQAYQEKQFRICTEELLAATKLARRSMELAAGQAVADLTNELAKAKDYFMQLQASLAAQPPAMSRPEMTAMTREAQKLCDQAGQYQAQGQHDAALAAYRTATQLLAGAARMQADLEKLVRQVQELVNLVRGTLDKVDALLQTKPNQDAAALRKLAAGLLDKASVALSKGNLPVAREYAATALGLAERALNGPRDNRPSVDRDELRSRLQDLDQRIEKAKQSIK